MTNYYLMGQTTAVISPTKTQLDEKKIDLDTRSEIRPQVHSKKPPIGRVVILPNGVIDERNHDQYIIKEQLEEYDNFDKNSYFASSLDDHDKIYIDSMKEKMQSSLGEWYQPGQDENDKPKKKK